MTRTEFRLTTVLRSEVEAIFCDAASLNVVNLMDALRRSVEAEKPGRASAWQVREEAREGSRASAQRRGRGGLRKTSRCPAGERKDASIDSGTISRCLRLFWVRHAH